MNNGGPINNNSSTHNGETVDEQLILLRDKLKRIESVIKKDNLYTQEPTFINNTVEPEIEEDGVIDFYKHNYGSPKMFTQGVLSWVTLLKKDVYLRSVVESSRRKKIIVTKSGRKEDTKETEFIKKFKVEQDFDAEISDTTSGQICKYKNKDILMMIKSTLVDSKLIWLLVEKFFDSELYLVLPLFDKAEFTSQLYDILGSKSSQRVLLNIRKKLQLNTIGILLIIMRLTSLSTYNALRSNTENLSENDLYILNNPVTKEYMTAAHRCYDEISQFREAHLEIFQFQLLSRYYDQLAPEDSDCNSMKTYENMGPLVHSAVSSGLNRDPSVADPGNENPNLLRRLWFKVVNLDYNQLMHIGCPPMINVRFYDTLYPSLNPYDSPTEYAINQAIHKRKDIYEMCHPLLMLLLNVRDPPRLSTVKQHLRPLENLVQAHPKVSDIMNMPSDTVLQRFEKLTSVAGLVDTTSLLYMIYYHIYLHYNERGIKDKSLYYLLEIIKIMAGAFPLINFLLEETEYNSDYNLKNHFGIPILVIPEIELLSHRSIQVMFSLLARIKAMKVFTIDLDPAKLELVDNIADSLLRSASYILKGFLNIADTYYHSWAMSRIHSFILKDILYNKRGPYNPENASDADRAFIKNLNLVRDHDELFMKYSIDDLKQIYESVKELERCGTGSERPSPTGSVDMTFSSAANQHDSLWFNQFQSDTGLLYDNKGHMGASSSASSGPTISDPILDRMDDPVINNFDIMDIERFFFHSTNEPMF